MTTKLGQIIADFSTSLATAMAVGATTASLQSATDDDGVALPSGIYYFAIDGNNAQKEHIQATLSGANLSNIKSVSRQGTLTSGCVRSHRVGATVTLTDFAHLRFINDVLTGATDLDSSTPLKYDGTAGITNNNHLATKAYVDGVAIAGAPNASDTTKGITKLSVAPASATAPIAVGDNDPRVPTSGQAAALAGNGGTPGSGNKYVTEAGFANIAKSIVRTYTSTSTWTKPAGIVAAYVYCVGGGGGGSVLTGGGGGNGKYGWFSAAQLPSSAAITIGAGGSAGSVANNSAQTDGGNTSFGSLLTAYGGKKGGAGNNTGGNGGSSFSGGGGDAGTSAANTAGGSSVSGGGGGGGGTTSGGSSVYGGGGGVSGGGGSAGTSDFAGAGGATETAGTAPGGGGGGCANTAGHVAGAGAAGQCVVIEFY